MMDRNKIDYIKKEIQYCLLAGFISLVAVYFFLGLKGVDLNIHFRYGGSDAFGGLVAAQNFITGNGRYIYPNMGAPGTVNVANFPDVSNLEYFSMWILSLFIKEPGLLVNIFYILNFSVIAIITTISFRIIKISPISSIVGGVLYSLLMYNFYRGEQHLFLSTYAIVPLACILILWIINGELIFNKNNNTNKNVLKKSLILSKKLILSFLFAILIGMTNPYYTFFACLGVIFSIIWNLIEERNFKKIVAPLIILFIILITVFFNLIPFFLNLLNGYESGLLGTRSSYEVEYYGLKLTQLLLPVGGHRIPLFAKIRAFYEENISLINNESYGSSLGLFISIGLIISFIVSMCRDKGDQENISIKHSAVLNIFILILGCIGGFSSFIGAFVSSIRCYNRLSLFIAFYSLYIVIYYIDSFFFKHKIKNIIKVIIITIIGMLSALDMVGANNSVGGEENQYYIYRKNQYYIHKEFIKKIEDVTPKESMIFQLPFVPSNHHTEFANIGPYQQFYPFIHSSFLKWSYRAQQGSEIEKWQNKVAHMPIESMLKHLAGIGFMGLYIDKFGYTENEYNNLRKDINKITKVEPIISKDGRMLYYYLEEYFKNLKKTFDENEKILYENISYVNYNNYSIISNFNDIFQASNSFYNTLISGWSHLEKWGVWSDGNTAQLGFSLQEKKEVFINLNFHVFPNPTYFSIDINGVRINEYIVSGAYEITIPIKTDYLMEKNNKYPVTVQFNIKNPAIPKGDPRKLGIGLFSFFISTVE